MGKNPEPCFIAEGGQKRTAGQGRVAVLHLPLAHLHIICGSRSNIFCISQERGKMYIIYDHLWSRIYRMPESGTSTNTQRCKTDAECIPNLQSLVQGVICSTRARWNLRTKPLASWRWCWLSYQSVWDLSTSVTRINSVTVCNRAPPNSCDVLGRSACTAFQVDNGIFARSPAYIESSKKCDPPLFRYKHPSFCDTNLRIEEAALHWIDHVNQDH